MTDAELDALHEPASWGEVFEERTVAALRLADVMCGGPAPPDAALTDLLRHHYTEGELAELILVCGQANLNNRAANAAKHLLGP